MKTDIQIADEATARPITEIAQKAGIPESRLEQYGRYKAKVKPCFTDDTPVTAGKLVLVTALSPTPAGEGKTTTTVGLADALNKLGKNACAALREPSLGPVFGIKGGATGGGYAQIIPMEDINLHFTGDFHAITAANNLLAAMVDNHIYQGNALDIDPQSITFRRCLDMNDRQLRHIKDGLGGKASGVPRDDGFEITAASEVMAVLCLSSGISELKEKLAHITVGRTSSGKPVYAGDLNAEGAMAALLKDAICPNLVQTLEGTPALVHGGPFANIAHGCNSLAATKLAMSISDYTVTEAGFGADLGAEKFFDIKCRLGSLRPSAVVIVATVRALKMHGGVSRDELKSENTDALKKGLPNLLRHCDNIKNVFSLPFTVAVNRYPSDTDAEVLLLLEELASRGIRAAVSTACTDGGNGALELAGQVVELCGQENNFSYCYSLDDSIESKITSISRRIYRADGVDFSDEAAEDIAWLTANGFSQLPVCMAKTQYSFSDDPKLIGAPEGFRITVRSVKASSGAGFLVALTGTVMTMPGLPPAPAAVNIDVDADGNISGLF